MAVLHVPSTDWPRFLIAGRFRLARFSVVSMGATALSQVVLLVLFWLGGMDATAASTVAFVAGAVPQYLIMRQWVWGRRDESVSWRQLSIYVAVTLAGGLASIGFASLVDLMVQPLISDDATVTVLVNIGYLLGGAPIFLAKFLLLDKVFTPAQPA